MERSLAVAPASSSCMPNRLLTARHVAPAAAAPASPSDEEGNLGSAPRDGSVEMRDEERSGESAPDSDDPLETRATQTRAESPERRDQTL